MSSESSNDFIYNLESAVALLVNWGFVYGDDTVRLIFFFYKKWVFFFPIS